MKPTLHVRIISPQQLILDTEASSVSSKNFLGPFDILPMHANFITVVEDEPIIIRTPQKPASPEASRGGPLTYKFPIAIIYTTQNLVNIYTYIQPSLEKK